MNQAATRTALSQRLGINAQAKVLIVGAGATGLSVARFLHQHHIDWAVVDSRSQPPARDALLQLQPTASITTGNFAAASFAGATHLMVSPGVSLKDQAIASSSARIISDIDLFVCACRRPIVAITGSNGKSTVTAMLGAMGNKSGVKTAIGGNFGIAALDLLASEVRLYVLELSSFQLERSNELNATASVVLNISPDHLDRHHDLQSYAAVKAKIYQGDGVMVLNADDTMVQDMAVAGRDTVQFSCIKTADFHRQKFQDDVWLMHGDTPLLACSALPLTGTHNIANALAALALGTAVGLDREAQANGLREFAGLAHRMQKIATINGVTWINDSKATNVDASLAALNSYREKIVLIAGGDAKGGKIAEMIPTLKAKVRYVVLLGKDAEIFAGAIQNAVPYTFAENISTAVRIAAGRATAGEIVLLSPACASWDQFKNYQERGEQFASAVLGLAS